MIFVIGLSLSALVLTSIGVAVIRRWAARGRMLDVPTERSSHAHPMPRGGGLAIVAVVLAGIWLYAIGNPEFPWREMLAFTAGGVLIAGVGWLDDMHPLSPRLRFLVHALAACIAIAGIGFIQFVSIPLIPYISLGWVGFPLTLVWIIGLTNAYNFMDGIDGIASGQALMAGLGWAILGWSVGQPIVVVMGLLFAASSLGFLGHNWPPARIFMGDVGSGFLGYAFAVLTVLAAQSNPIFVLAGMALVWPFVFDATLTLFRRLCRGEKVWVAHRSHIYQRLVISGLSHRQVSSLYTGLALLGTAWAIALVLGWHWLAIAGAVVITAAALSLCAWTSLREGFHHSAPGSEPDIR